ncbi:MAG: arginase [Porphyromonadaceae bacterium]|nr:arginase [Porphyromonadaceae bacterium]
MKKIDIIGVQMDMGAGTRGVNMGPAAIRYAGVVNGIRELGMECNDKGDLIPLATGATSENMRCYEQVHDINEKLYHSVMDSLENGAFPVVLGGDHSIAAGSISATAKNYKKIGVIWVDAHGDWNNEESSPSGNMHGMPFSAVCGAGPDIMVDFGQEPVFVDTKNCVQIAGRDIDPMERVRMKEHGITVFSIADIDRLGMPAVIEKAIEIASDGTEGIHVSFDVDSITPESAPGTGTIVHSGLTLREAFYLIETLCISGKVLALDMVEVNPMLDIKNKTGELAMELILSMLGKVVY